MEIVSITSSEYKSNSMLQKKFYITAVPKSREDVATLLEVFERLLGLGISSSRVVSVVADDSGKYVFIVNNDESGNFDLYDFINQNYSGDTVVNCVNAKMLFPKSLSRGVFNGSMYEEKEGNTQNLSDSEEDTPTGYIDEDELDAIVNGGSKKLLHVRLGLEIPIPSDGIIIGRSSKQSQYIVHGNINVSRKHARVFFREGNYYIHNYEPPNGTYVNGLKVGNNDDMLIPDDGTLMLADEEFKLI